MFQIDVSTAATTQPASTAAGAPGFFTDGNPATGVAATVLPAEFMNTLMLEMLNVVKAAGITPSKTAFNQLATAIKGLSQQGAALYGADTGAANIYAVAYDPAVTALTDGMVMRFAAKAANTGASTFSPNGVTAKPILTPALAPLAGGEIIAASICTVVYSTSQAAWILLHATGGAQRMAASNVGKADMNAAVQGSYNAYNGADSDASTYNWPVLAGGSSSLLVWWNVHTYGVGGNSPRKFQMATHAFAGSHQGRTFMRQLHDTTWSSWRELVFADVMQSFGLGATTGPAVTDLNALTQTGLFRVESTASNLPEANNSIVLNIQFNANGSFQLVARVASNIASAKLYWRTQSAGSWSGWKQVAPLSSPAFTDAPTAPTPAVGDSSTLLATTAFAQGLSKGFTYKDVSGAADVTLTAADVGVGVIVLTGTLTGNISVILPAMGQWLITNRTSGAYTLTIKGKSNDPGIQLGAAKNGQFWSDGTNVYPGISDPHGITRFTASGTFTVPAGVTTLYLSGCAGGSGGAGGGGAVNQSGVGGGGAGGSAGQSAIRVPVTVTPGQAYQVVIGAAGSGGGAGLPSQNGGSSGAGGNTSFGSIFSLSGGASSSGGATFTGALSPGGAPGTGYPAGSFGCDGIVGANGGVGNGGPGASSPFGGGGGLGRGGSTGVAGQAAAGYGSGGGGGGAGYGGSNAGANGGVGAAGAPGILIVEW